MKLNKYLMIALAAISAVGTTVSCNDVDEVTYLDDIQVSKSYVTFDAAGGTNTIVVTADDSWSFSTASDYAIPDWVTVSPTSGSEGQTTVTFTAGAATETQTATVAIVCDGETQLINLLQQTEKVETPLSTCAEVLAGPDSKTYRVKGVVTKIANTTYGNWYLNDGTGEVYIYGTLDAKGNEKNFLSTGIEVGDEVTVEGPKTTYNGTVELVNVTVIELNKSLIKCDSTYVAGVSSNELPIEGGELTAYLTNKANGVTINIPEDAKSWLSVSGIDISGTSNVITLLAAANAGGDRSTTVTFETTDGSKTYTAQQEIVQKGAILEVSIADFNAAEVGDTQYRITAVVSSIYNAEKGRFYIKDWSGETYVYNLSGFADLGIKEGDIITIVGKRDQYKETIEMTSATIEDHISVTPISIADFLTKEDSNDVYYMVTGTITKIDNPTYGNLYLNDGTELYVYGCYPGWGASGDNRKNFLETAGIVEGDTLSVIGVKSTYKDVPQLKNGIYFSHTKAGATE
jgi:DNA/RNA endonuclease YhcR with UshA esterase domain